MNKITITVERAKVLDEVAKHTAYTGAKRLGLGGENADDEVSDRMLAGDDDLADLSRMWADSVTAANQSLDAQLVAGGEDAAGNYRAVIEVSDAWNYALESDIAEALATYFVQSIAGQWYAFMDKDEAKACIDAAGAVLQQIDRMLCVRVRPVLPK